MSLAMMYALLPQTSAPPTTAASAEGIAKAIAAWLAIPVAIATAFAAIYIVPKARLEKRKFELEILEKEKALGIAREAGDTAAAATIVAGPILEGRRAQVIILRFILLYLVLQVWGIIGRLFDVRAIGGPFWLADLINSIPGLIWALLFVGIGWPLLLDVAKLLHVELPAFIRSAAMRWVLVAIAVLAALSRNLLSVGLGFFV
jgi:hypothetical protein